MVITFKLIGHIQGLDVISPSLGFKLELPLNMTRCDSMKRSKKFSLYSSKLLLGTNTDKKATTQLELNLKLKNFD